MELKQSDIEHLGELGRIKLTPEEIESLTGDMNKIVGFVDALQSVDITEEPNFEPIALGKLRADEVVASGITAEDMASIAPKTIDGQVAVLNVLEESN